MALTFVPGFPAVPLADLAMSFGRRSSTTTVCAASAIRRLAWWHQSERTPAALHLPCHPPLVAPLAGLKPRRVRHSENFAGAQCALPDVPVNANRPAVVLAGLSADLVEYRAEPLAAFRLEDGLLGNAIDMRVAAAPTKPLLAGPGHGDAAVPDAYPVGDGEAHPAVAPLELGAPALPFKEPPPSVGPALERVPH